MGRFSSVSLVNATWTKVMKESGVSVMRSGIVCKRLPSKKAGSSPSCAFLAVESHPDYLILTPWSERYDVTGVDPSRVADVIERDWIHLLHEKNVIDSPSYLRESGKVVIALWGMF